MSEIQANCPHCGTTFTVSSDQLRVANGHVRCGVCMKVFKAGNGEAENTAAQGSSATSSASLDDDASIEAWIKKNQKTGNKNIQSGPVEAPENINRENLSFDDDFTDAFQDLDSSSDDRQGTASGKQASKAEAQDDELDHPELQVDIDIEEEDKPDLFEIEELKNKRHEKGLDDIRTSDNNFESDFVEDFDGDLFSSDEEEPVLQVALGSTEIEDEPSFESKHIPGFIWPGLTVLFALILISQILVKNFESLALEPGYRGFYSIFCSMGVCKLPTFSNVQSIRGSNLVVRPHPQQPGALIVDAIINNQAPFNQAFPDLYLSFSNIQGKVIASRQFKPREYLQGDLKGMQAMPSRSPLHLSLEVVDPGKQAVSYHLDFVEGS